MVVDHDFSGWGTKNDLECSDGRIIRHNAFAECDGATVPLVWNHQHNDPYNVLGHACLENRDDGVYVYGKFNDTEQGRNAKLLVEHGDISALSICANKLKQQGPNVLHGVIREVSLVLAGANPGAFIDSVISHGEDDGETAIIYTGESIELYHAEEDKEEKTNMAEGETTKSENTKADSKEKTVQDVIDTMNQEQQDVLYYLVGAARDDVEPDETDSDETEEDSNMKHNAFDAASNSANANTVETLSHAEEMEIIGDARRYGSLRESALQHGVEQIDYLFPDNKNVTDTPIFIQRDTTWVGQFLNATHKTPFSRIKSLFADITEDEARALGYIKGKYKKEEVFSLLKRTTDPTTVYKKQKMHRDDVVDIADFAVVNWIKTEMRGMLDEELARAGLVGDGRLASSDDKINEQCIRPIWTDEDLFTIKARFDSTGLSTEDEKMDQFIRTAIKARKNYKGSGSPIMFTTEDVLTDLLLMKDKMGRDLYETPEKLMKKLRVRDIATVPVMEGLTRQDSGSTYTLMAIIVNPVDYNIGADKGGAVNMFDDFDIDYNAQKYLIETRCSGALIKPYSAIAVEMKNPA